MFKFVMLTGLLSLASVLAVRNPVTELNAYIKPAFEMVSNTNDFDTMRQLLGSDQLNTKVSADAAELAKLVSDLVPETAWDFCEKPNIDKLRTIMAKVVGYDKKLFKKETFETKPTRKNLTLNYLLQDYTRAALELCLVKLKPKFMRRFNELGGINIHGVSTTILNLLDCFHKDRRQIDIISEAKAIKSLKDKATIKLKIELMYCAGKPASCRSDFKRETGWRDEFTRKQAESYLEKYLFRPCKSFLNDRQIQDVLTRVIALGEAALFGKCYPNFQGRIELLEWAGAAVACKSLTDNELNKFAKLMSEESHGFCDFPTSCLALFFNKYKRIKRKQAFVDSFYNRSPFLEDQTIYGDRICLCLPEDIS